MYTIQPHNPKYIITESTKYRPYAGDCLGTLSSAGPFVRLSTLSHLLPSNMRVEGIQDKYILHITDEGKFSSVFYVGIISVFIG